jgi:glycolate oxidase
MVQTRSHELDAAEVLPRFPDELALKAAARLARMIGSDKIVDDPDIAASYGGDESHLEPVAPAAVIRARSREDVRATLEVAGEAGVPVTPRSGGTGKSGGAIPVRGGWVLALAGLDQIVEVDEENLVVVAQPGVVTGRLHEEVEARGLFFPPDPASLETCCLGGNVAENAGGPRAFKYGVTSHYVLGLEVVVPAGARCLRVGRRTVKGVAGYDVTSLLVGSEGTLGVFTEVTLRLVPRPQAVRTLLGLFADPAAAGRAVSRMVRDGLVPRVIELLDGTSVETLRSARKLPFPAAAGAVLLVEVDGDERGLDEQVERVAAACEAQGCVDVLAMRTQAEARALWAGRRELSELLTRSAGHKLADDIVVPRSAIAEMIQLSEAIGARHDVRVATYGHAGDGNLHVNVLWDGDDGASATMALEEIVTAAVRLGGTITGEHGVGAAKRHLLRLEQSPELIALQRQLKSVFDPSGVLNPGKVLP